MTRQLADRIVLVTGAPAGPGPAICRRLAAEGAWVGVNFRRELEGAKQLVDQIRSDGGRAMLAPGDVAIPAQAWAVVERIDLAWGPLDLVVEQSGAERGEEYRIQDSEHRRRGSADGLLPSIQSEALLGLVVAALPGLRRSQHGQIIVVGPAGSTLRGTVARARALARDTAIDVRGVWVSAGQSDEAVAAEVIRLIYATGQSPVSTTRAATRTRMR